MKRSLGWTLFELILILSIIALMGYVGFSYLQIFPKYRDTLYAQKLVSICRYAQNIAIASQCEVKWAYDGNYTLALFQRENCKGPYFKVEASQLQLGKDHGKIEALPLYFQSNAVVATMHHQVENDYEIKTRFHRLSINGQTGMCQLDVQ